MRPWFVSIVALAGCARLLGDDFAIADDDGSGGATTASSASSGGGGGQACAVGEIGVCGAGRKCSVIDYATGATACITAGDHPPFSFCSIDEECVDGTFCDPPGKVCLPVCTLSPCNNGGDCVQAATDQSGTMAVAGMEVCIANCAPLTGLPCSNAFGTVACIPGASDQFHCWQGGFRNVGEACADITECVLGSVCAGDPLICRKWCTPIGDPCQGTEVCMGTDPAFYSMGVQFGICG